VDKRNGRLLDIRVRAITCDFYFIPVLDNPRWCAVSIAVSVHTWPIFYLQSIMEHNGGSVVAMAGKDCVAIASDLRLGAGAMTVALNFEKVSHGLSPLLFHY
jgi:hypothetical protein